MVQKKKVAYPGQKCKGLLLLKEQKVKISKIVKLYMAFIYH